MRFDQQNKILTRNFGKSFADGTTQHLKKPQQTALVPLIALPIGTNHVQNQSIKRELSL